VRSKHDSLDASAESGLDYRRPSGIETKRMNPFESPNGVLLEPGNAYHTHIRLDDRRLFLAQRRLLPAFWISVFAAMGYAMSPWLGVPLFVIAGLYLVWKKSIEVDLASGEVRAVTGIPPLLHRFRGTRDDINHVELREVVMSRTTDGTQSFGKWRTWDVTIHVFGDRFNFSAWEEGNEDRTLRVAMALASLLHCQVKRVSRGGATAGT
jgi:hypothetical protein